MTVKEMLEKLTGLPEELPVYVLSGVCGGIDFPELKELIIEYDGEEVNGILLATSEDKKLCSSPTTNFGGALEMLKRGERMRRRGWNGKGIYIELQHPDWHSKMTHPYIFIDSTGLQTDNPDSPKNRVPWLASQTDMMAEDWEVYL